MGIYPYVYEYNLTVMIDDKSDHLWNIELTKKSDPHLGGG